MIVKEDNTQLPLEIEGVPLVRRNEQGARSKASWQYQNDDLGNGHTEAGVSARR